MSKPDKPAFPVTYTGDEDRFGERHIQSRGGLTRRELFAAMAMQGICARHANLSDATADLAVSYADALIARLDQ